jgi:hypothetical protein
MSVYVIPAIALVSASAALATLLITLHASRRSDRDSAREEALALAELRGQMLLELHADYELRTRALEAAVAELARRLEDSTSGCPADSRAESRPSSRTPSRAGS